MMKRLTMSFLESCFNVLLLHVMSRFQELRQNARFHRSFVRVTAHFVSFVNLQAQDLRDHDRNGNDLFPTIYGILNVDLLLFYSRYINELVSLKQWTTLIDTVSWFRQILQVLYRMQLDDDVSIRDASRTVQSNLFYHFHVIIELRQVMVEIKNPNSRTVLELVEANHALLTLIEAYCQAHRHIVTRKPKRGAALTDNDLDSNENSEDERRLAFVERSVDFESFVTSYSHDRVVDLYMTLLTHGIDTDLGGSTGPTTRPTGWLTLEHQEHVAWFLGKVYSDAPSLFHRITVIDGLYRHVLVPGHRKTSKHTIHEPLLDFGKKVIRDVVQMLKANSDAIVFLLAVHHQTPIQIMKLGEHRPVDTIIEEDVSDEEEGVDFAITQLPYLVRRLVDQFDLGSLLHTWIGGYLLDAATFGLDSPKGVEEGLVPFDQEMERPHRSPFPLPCTNETQRTAIKRPLFGSLLRCLGFVKVNRDAWEMPVTTTADECIRRAELLEKAIDSAEKGIEEGGFNSNSEADQTTTSSLSSEKEL